ncbi:MAG: hypothetical protein NC124_02290 [Clostridium sp.]|nr:hypothetical protein [Clostridium sp.]
MSLKTPFFPLGGKKEPYKRGTDLLVITSVGSGSFELLTTGWYEVTLVGAGGGSSNPAGASGAIIVVQMKLKKGRVSYYIGKGGSGCGAYARNNNGQPGENSTFTHSQANIIATRGTQGNGRRNGGATGYSSVCTYSITAPYTVIRNDAGVYDGVSPITWDYNGPGKAGRPVCDTCAGQPGGNGYLKIRFIK